MKKMSLNEMRSLSRDEMKKIMAGSGTMKCCWTGTSNCSGCVFVCSGCTVSCSAGASVTGC